MAGRRAVAKAAEAFDQVVDFLESFEALDDHRQRGNCSPVCVGLTRVVGVERVAWS